jgi:hypothetical protein
MDKCLKTVAKNLRLFQKHKAEDPDSDLQLAKRSKEFSALHFCF